MTAKRTIRVATRASALALAQTGHVIDAIREAYPDLELELVKVRTTGDKIQTEGEKSLDATKNIFTREIEAVLLSGDADLAVHSCKDLGVQMPCGLVLAGSPPRRSPEDLLILRPEVDPEHLPDEAAILTGSIRRRLQWLEFHPRHRVLPVRGNIDTRIQKLQQHPDALGLILARCGLDRLHPELKGCKRKVLNLDEMLPAPGQGALALQCREEDEEVVRVIESISDPNTFQSILAERAFLAAMDAGCQEPLGALATPDHHGNLCMRAVYYPEECPGSARRATVTGTLDAPEMMAQRLAEKLGV